MKEEMKTELNIKLRNNKLTFSVTKHSGLLEFLLLNIHGKSRNNIKSLLKHEAVLVDGKAVTQFNYVLKPGQSVSINNTANKMIHQKLIILYEDREFIVINKPAGLLAIATEKEKENTAYHMLTDYVSKDNPGSRIFSVHRLDRDTSGVLLFAKNEKIKYALQDNWADLVNERRYIAIIEGRLNEKSGRIQSWLKQTDSLLVYSSGKPGDGQEAITDYEVIKENEEYSMLDIRLETGRKNQIRVHMKELGHSVAGDKKYGAKTNPMKRLGLHAYKLELKHPFTNEMLCFEAEIPESFFALLK